VIEYLDSSSFASMFAKKQHETNGDAVPDKNHLYTEGVTTQAVQEGGGGGQEDVEEERKECGERVDESVCGSVCTGELVPGTNSRKSARYSIYYAKYL